MYVGVNCTLTVKPRPPVPEGSSPSSEYTFKRLEVDDVMLIVTVQPACPAVPTLVTPVVYSLPDPLGPSLSSAENLKALPALDE